jgi:dipeptidyl aminopeptidase/acylaminoacyl peptidase
LAATDCIRPSSIHTYLDEPEARPPQPRVLVEKTVVPRIHQSNSYGSVVTEAQWSSDSLSILFLSEETDRKRHLFRVWIKSGDLQPLTDPIENVENYSESAGTIVYSTKAASGVRAMSKSLPTLNVSVSRLTGLSLTAILHPELLENPDSLAVPRDLWVRKNSGSPAQINHSTGADEWHIPSALSTQFRPAISPNGRAAIVAMPALNIPAKWNTFKFASDLYRFEKLKIDKDPAGTSWSWPWQYAYVDLDRRDIFPLVDAPSAMQAGYYDPFQAAWSADGRRVLFTNSFMSSSNAARGGGSPCTVAIFTLSNRIADCVAFARFPKSNTHLVSAGFGISSNEVILKWDQGGTSENETYREQEQNWTLAQPILPASDNDRALSIFVKQDISVPPTLWVTDVTTGKSKQLWDPNPQLKGLQLGEASVYRWKDSTGYEWTAGLVKPSNFVPGHRYPLVIQTHGFFNEHEFLVDGSFTTGFAAQPLAASGLMVLQMGDRIDRHIKPATEEATLMATAFRDAVAHLDRDGLIDPSNVGIIGFSRTSWYVETALIQFPQLFRAATIIDGVDESYMSYMLFCPFYRECQIDHEAATGGRPFGKEIRTWLDTADGFNLDRIQTPLRIEAIGPMSVLGEWEIYSSLSMQDKQVDLIYLPDGQHILQKPQERHASQQGNVDWFHRWLDVR